MDFRTFVDQLDSADDLLWIKDEVDPEYELSALVQQAEARHKAIWLERVKGSDYPTVGGVMSTPERHALAIGRSPAAMSEPGAWAATIAAARSNPLTATTLETGPAADIVLLGDDIDVGTLPAPTSFPGDTHRFLTSGLGIVLDPETGIQNVGFYRAPLIDKKTISVSAGMSSRLKQIYQAAADKGPTLPIAYAIGVPPALLITAGCRINRDESDMDIAGALQGKPLELIKCQTNDLLVPAQAEIIIEAEVELGNMVEHTMGEFPDNYGKTASPIARITAITHRQNAVYHTILGGMTREHNTLGAYIFVGLREQLLEQLRPAFPGLQDIHVDLTPRRMGGRCQIAVAINKSADDEPQRLMDAIYAQHFDTFPLAMVVQRIVIVDEDVEITSKTDVEWAIAMRVNNADKFRVIEAPTKAGGTTARFAIDATLGLDEKAAGKRPHNPNIGNYPLDKYL
jgi:2,5-furandicarboxylate decarboxylase 1